MRADLAQHGDGFLFRAAATDAAAAPSDESVDGHAPDGVRGANPPQTLPVRFSRKPPARIGRDHSRKTWQPIIICTGVRVQTCSSGLIAAAVGLIRWLVAAAVRCCSGGFHANFLLRRRGSTLPDPAASPASPNRACCNRCLHSRTGSRRAPLAARHRNLDAYVLRRVASWSSIQRPAATDAAPRRCPPSPSGSAPSTRR